MRNVMKRAWEIYRTLTGDRIAKLSAALKQAWAECKANVEETAVQMLNAYVANCMGDVKSLAEKIVAKLGIVLDGRTVTIHSDIVKANRAYATLESFVDFIQTHLDCVAHGTWREITCITVEDRELPKRRRRNRPTGDTMTADDVRRYTEAYFAAEEM